MTTQPEALRQRLLDHAACHEAEHTLMGEDEQRQWAADLREADALIGHLHAECEALRATQSDTLLRLLCDLRFALGDNGARMQHDLVEYARGMRADAERWRKWLPWIGSLNRKPFGLAMEIKQIDAARAAKEQA